MCELCLILAAIFGKSYVEFDEVRIVNKINEVKPIFNIQNFYTGWTKKNY